MRLTIGTFNLRNVADRYDERRPLLAARFAAFAPGIVALQEVSLRPGERQDDLLMAAAPAHAYHSFAVPLARHPGFGLAILVATGDVLAHETIALDAGRIAQRVLLALPGQRTLWVANTHLHHRAEEPGVRRAQAEAIVTWMADAPRADAAVVAGDFNDLPGSAACATMRAAGYRSAHAEANGAEPARTWPSGIVAPGADHAGEPGCVDYLWLAGAARAVAAGIACDEPAAGDATLYASDHFAVWAALEL